MKGVIVTILPRVVILCLTLLTLAACVTGDGSYTGAPDPQPVEYQSTRP
jgi:hypothetical protein